MVTMRQRAIAFPEPRGALAGLLYAWIKPLLTSPPPIQAAALRHFHSVLAMSAMLASMAVSYLLFQGSAHEGIVSWVYLPITGLSLLTSLLQAPSADLAEEEGTGADMMLWKLIGLVLFSVVAPVAIPRFVPAYHLAPLWIAPLLLLAASMVSSMLFLMSLLSQLDNVRQTSVSCEQTTLSMNCHPSQLWPKLSRDFQDSWVRNIPNRSYANMPPASADGERGAFKGSILQETQPTASSTMGFASLAEALAVKQVRYLLWLGAWGLVLCAATVAVATRAAPLFESMAGIDIVRVLLVVTALNAVTMLTFRIGHLLWSRMHFKSRLIWITVNGTFQRAELRIGNQFTGNAQSRSSLTRVEDATLRVWVSDIVSVAFGKEGKRFIMALAPADGIAKSMADGLKEFALEQGAVAAPTSSRDFSRARTMGMLDTAFGAPGGNVFPVLNDGVARHDAGNSKDSERLTGRVKFYDAAKEFGFIAGSDGADYFFHANQLNGASIASGQRVDFMPVPAARGPQANQVRAMA
jgi:cold shock CspA family protein